MRIGPFDKFSWLKSLQSDPEVTATAAFLVGVAICTTFTRADGSGWVFELSRLPAMGGKPLAPNTVKAAIRLLVLRGYLEQTHRCQGGRGVRAAASFDLKPARLNAHVLTENPHVQTDGFSENPHVSTIKPARLNDETRSFQRTKNGADQRFNPPTGTSTGTSTGDGRDVERTDKPDNLPDWATPPPECPKHPNGNQHGQPCGRCAALRKWNTKEAKAERQDANYRQAHTEWNQLVAKARAGLYGEWQPEKPPLNRSDFDPDVPWRQPSPPPESALSVNGYDGW